MKHAKWQLFLGLSLLTLSAIFYWIHYAIFKDAHHIFLYLIGDTAFVFIQVLLVTLIIDQVLVIREKRLLLEKMNMVIGTFFSEVGKDLLKMFAGFDPQVERIRQGLIVTDRWTTAQFLDMSKEMKAYRYDIDIAEKSLQELKQMLMEKREFLLRLLENQNLLEHDTFTALLLAVFHLTEELESRNDILHLLGEDRKHLAGDMKRAYTLLIGEWLDYMKYLKENYPYLFSFAMRTNPFDMNASPEIKESA
jgi:hypothetical protein